MSAAGPVAQTHGRVEMLDYCRGLMAFAVMIYHYNLFGGLPLPAIVLPLVKLLGIYAVATFYVLSGATLAIVYRSSPPTSWPTFGRFGVRRFFRLAPVLWLATLSTIALGLVLSGPKSLPGGTEIFLNLTGLFGLFAYKDHIAVGAWSIGNEVVFYLVFPFLMLSTRRAWTYLAALALCVAIGAWFAFMAMDPGKTAGQQSWAYMHPLNQLFLFAAGVGIGAFAYRRIQLPGGAGWALALAAAAGLGAFAGLYSGGELVTGWRRFALSALCCVLAFVCVAVEAPTRQRLLTRAVAFLGVVSYSLYLLHPLVFRVVDVAFHLAKLPLAFGAGPVSIVLTLAATGLCYRLIEAPAIRLGQRLTPRTRVSSPLASPVAEAA